jgi:beta-phosphoglucomutase-like phosphatase (HAD superfamily)
MTRTRAIVFDMDGVVIDSEELHAHAKRIAFAHAGIALPDADLRSYVGRSDAVMIDEIGARYGLTDGQRSVLNERRGYLLCFFEDQVQEASGLSCGTPEPELSYQLRLLVAIKCL